LEERTERPLLSACLIVRDEEPNLPRCLSSIQPFVDEIIAVDTGSTDDTVAILEAFGARVLRTEWRNDFAFHRNQAIDMATSTFAMMIDADEELVETDPEEERRHLANDELPPVVLVRERLLYASGRSATVLLPRIVRRDSGLRYNFPIHEQLTGDEDCDAVVSDIKFLHHGYLGETDLLAKESRNLAIALTMGDHAHGLHCVARARLSLREWAGVVDACERLLQMDVPPVIRVEACAMGGTAALNLADMKRLEEFADRATEWAVQAPDIMLLRFISAGAKYLSCLEANDCGSQGDFLRPLFLSHSLDLVRKMLQALIGPHSMPGRALASVQRHEATYLETQEAK